MCTHHVQMCYMTADVDIPEETYGERETVVFMAGDAGDGGQRVGGGERPCALAIADTACTKTVAGHQWYEDYCRWADDRGLPIEIVEEKDQFKFGASRIHPSMFAIWEIFEVGGKLIRVKVAIVQCRVPLLFSRTVLAKLGMVYHVGAQRADLTHLGLFDLEMAVSETGHPAFVVTDIGDRANCGSEFLWSGDPEVQLCDSSVVEQYMAEPIHAGGGSAQSFRPLFFPKKISTTVNNMLQDPDLSPSSFFMWWKSANQEEIFGWRTRMK